MKPRFFLSSHSHPFFKEEKDIPDRRETGPNPEAREECGAQGTLRLLVASPGPELLVPSETVRDSEEDPRRRGGRLLRWVVSHERCKVRAAPNST